MHLSSVFSILGLTAVAFAQSGADQSDAGAADPNPYDAPCGSYKTCLATCPNEDFFPLADECDTDDDGKPYCYVNFWCA
ncbi:hypothetical protein P170DRAFT_475623 [Aspergillus steynii IBT 23096]|uniref:Uncharacterized protein n=1 Tax=Aspergillus steynii IBT 23096 TaxID=1392250 RepID=A0A2I2G911_9EURO|nr:uncharacterized protein P170DRAFT_475623 [Aspergillus steynii IBT 23096]PLB49323.1 hypothetical protein P170DRAFT_475623 [Aspergillus steynii IBT 23096]